jgi:hypothetical protein
MLSPRVRRHLGGNLSKTKRSSRPTGLSLHRSKESALKEVFPKANFASDTRKPHLSLWSTLGLDLWAE